ncbi:MAG: SulP family inorganic anion transporter [Myxococcota bacterium]|nr:SulP family inorganic anion transporter [Myxococcota bacterium]
MRVHARKAGVAGGTLEETPLATVARVKRFLPFLSSRPARASALGRDALAALATTFLAIPQGVAYAMIAGLPPVMGLYASVVPTIIGSLFRSSRHVVSGPTNAVSLLVGGAVGALAQDLGAAPAEVALSMAMMVGLMQLGAGLLRLGTVVDYISSSVVLGYITGAGVLIGIGQLPNLTGTTGAHGDVVTQVAGWLAGLHGVNPTAVAVAVSTASLVVALRRLGQRVPGELIALVVATAACVGLGLSDRLAVVGDLSPVPASLPPLTAPAILEPRLLMVALAATVLSLVESSSLARSIADRTGDRLDLSVEFAGQGLSNIAAAFTGGYPVSGSLARSALNHSAGAQTRWSGVLCGVFVAAGLLLGGPLIERVPIAALAGLLLVVAHRLVNVSRIRQTFRAGRADALAFLGTLAGTWALRLDHAIYLGVSISIVLFLRRARLLVVRELRVDTSGRLREVATEGASPATCVRVVHVEGPLFFGAAGELRDALGAMAGDGVGALVVRLKRAQGMDLTTATALAAIAEGLAEQGRHLVLVGMRPDAMGVLERSGAAARIGRANLFPTQDGWFEALDAGLARALALAEAPEDSPLRAYLAMRAGRAQQG